MHFGPIADREPVPDLDLLASFMQDELRELLAVVAASDAGAASLG